MNEPTLKIVIIDDAAPNSETVATGQPGQDDPAPGVFTTGDQPCCRGRGGLVFRTTGRAASTPAQPAEAHEHQDDRSCCRHRLIEMVGRGRKNYPLPQVSDVVQKAAIRLAQIGLELKGLPDADWGPITSGSGSGTPQSGKGHGFHSQPGLLEMMRAIIGTGTTANADWRTRLVKRMREADASVSGNAGGSVSGKQPQRAAAPAAGGLKANPNALRVTAEALRLIFKEQMFEGLISRLFNPGRAVLKRARRERAAKYQPTIESLSNQFEPLREVFRQALPQVYDLAKAQMPDASDQELKQVALQVLLEQEELAQLIFILDHYIDCFLQMEDGMYEPLQALVAVVEEATSLWLTGDIRGARAKAGQAIAESTYFLLEHVYLAHAGDDGPATIPGANGPVGAHLILVPEDEVGIIMLMMVLYLHEFRHDMFASIKNLPEEEAIALLNKLRDAHKSGRLKLSAESMRLGKTDVPLIDLICRIFLDNLGEIDADLVGGIEMCGWAFVLNMLYVFGAFNSKKQGAIRNKQLLRTSSYFQVSKDGELAFEAHPVDYFRVYLCAAALELLEFKAEAGELRKLADAAVGGQRPEFITWEDVEEKRKPIQIRFDDMLACAPIVAEAVLKSPLKALKGKSNHEVVFWTRKAQDKTDLLVANLLNDSAEVPTDCGDFYLTHVSAAAAIALYQAIANHVVDPTDAPQFVNRNALKMHSTILARLEAEASTTEGEAGKGK